MNYFIFPLQIVTIFMSMKFPLILSFYDEKIIDRVGPESTQTRITEPSKVRNSLIIESLNNNLNSNMVIFTDKRRYSLNLIIEEERAYPEIEIHSAIKDRNFKIIESNSDYQLLKGEHSLMVEAKNNKEVEFNGIKVTGTQYFSLGPPLYKTEKDSKTLIYFRR